MFIQANIGRNFATGGTPETATMADSAWARFQEDVRDAIIIAIYSANPELPGLKLQGQFQFHTGMGEWGGVKEESAHVSIYFDTPRGFRIARTHEHLSDELVRLAEEYGQDAIAFVVTDSHLATR